MKLKCSIPTLAMLLLGCVQASTAAEPVEKSFIYKKFPQGDLQLIVTLPPDAKSGDKHAAIVFFSGGAWGNSNINQFKEQATYLAKRGMVAVRVDYRTSKSHNVGPDKCVEDARSSVRWVRAHAAELGVDPDRVAASGASAGGHLAACTATAVAPDAETDDLKFSCAPNALVLLNCVADLTIGGMATRAGGAEMARRISPVLHVNAATPPTLILDGADDNWVSTAKQFTDKAAALGVRCEFYLAEGKGHQFSGGSPWREATIHQMDEFFTSLGWLTGPPVMASPTNAVWVKYQPDPTAKSSDVSSQAKLLEMQKNRKKQTDRKAGAPAASSEGSPESPGAAPDAPPAVPATTADPKKDGSEDRRAQFMKRRMEQKAAAPAPASDDAPKKSETADPKRGGLDARRIEMMKKMRDRKSAAPAAPETPPAPAAHTASPPSVAVDIQIASDKPVPVNPRVYGTWCEEMFSKGLANEPEYIAALVDLKFKTFLFPGGSLSYYHHPKGPGGFNIRPEELKHSKYGEQGSAAKQKGGNDMSDLGASITARYLRGNSDPDYFEQYIRFVKASGGEAVFVANILNGTVEELDEYLTRLKKEGIPITAVVLGVEMHLGPAQSLGADGYVERIKPYITFLQAKYPGVPVVAHSTPVGRAVELARASFHDWNQTLDKLPGIVGFSQYGWTEFAGQPRLQAGRGPATPRPPDEAWRQYDDFVQTFPSRQITAYQKDWGADKKMFLTQWGTHADHNTAVQGVHIANYYLFLAQYNAAHDDYFPIATSSVNLAQDVSTHASIGGTLYREKIELLTPYFYTKPFRHLFSGDKQLITATAQDTGKDGNVKALAAVGADGRKYVYLLNSGPAIALGKLSVDGATLPAELSLQVESVFAKSASGAASGKEVPVGTFAGEKKLGDVTLGPWSLTLLITPADGKKSLSRSEAAPEKVGATLPQSTNADQKALARRATDQKPPNHKEYDKNAGPLPDLEDVSYGNHELLKLDLWKAKSDQPTPILIFFHGGGGDKLMYRGNPLLTFCLNHGVSVASVNYRPNHSFPAPIPTQDAGRAVQFLRSEAAEYHLDSRRMAALGTSLGANVSIAVAYGDDLASPKSDDPVLRESSRLCFLITEDAGGGFAGSAGRKPAAGEKAGESSTTRQISKGAPPVLMTYTMALKELASLKETPKRELLHNPLFGQLLKKKLDAAGVECYLYHGGSKAPPDAEEKFIVDHFFGPSAPAAP